MKMCECKKPVKAVKFYESDPDVCCKCSLVIKFLTPVELAGVPAVIREVYDNAPLTETIIRRVLYRVQKDKYAEIIHAGGGWVDWTDQEVVEMLTKRLADKGE